MDINSNSFRETTERLLGSFKQRERFSFGIGEIASYAEIPQSKIRYWEKCGYIEPESSSKNQNRKYSYKTLIKVQVIKSYLNSGFTLAAAAGKASEYCEYLNTIRKMIRTRIKDIGTIDGAPAIDMGPLAHEPNKSIYFVNNGEKTDAIIK